MAVALSVVRLAVQVIALDRQVAEDTIPLAGMRAPIQAVAAVAELITT